MDRFSGLRFDRILCAVSLSPSSREVVRWAAALAAVDEGELRLFHAMEDSASAPSRPLAAAGAEVDHEQMLNRVSGLARHLAVHARVSAAVTNGTPLAEILRHARLIQADVIAIGLRERDGGVSALARQVAAAARCPVLAIPDADGGRGADERRIGSVVCAVNFLPASLAAADYALALGRKAGAPVAVVHVLREHWDGPERRDAIIDDTRQLVAYHFRQLLRIAMRDGSAEHDDATEVVVSGSPCIEIVREANARGADLIVIGVHADRDSGRDIGATAECVMAAARCPVLLIPQRLFRSHLL